MTAAPGSAPNRVGRAAEAALLLLAAGLFVALCGLRTAPPTAGPAAPAGASATVAPSWLLPLDDAYIFVRYAQQAARGRPWQWSDGEPSSGASSFLYPWLLVPGQWLTEGIAGWSWWSRWVGGLGLWALGLAAAAAARRAGGAAPWPTATGLVLVWCGPIAFASIGGMESALDAALILMVATGWGAAEASGRRPGTATLVGTALLPLVRPENALLTGLGALRLLLRGPWRHWVAGGLVLIPGALLAALNLAVTGELAPAGALAKSRLGAPFLGPLELAGLYRDSLLSEVLPVYLGRVPEILPPPVGLLALAGAALAAWPRRLRADSGADWRGLRPVAVAWLALVLLAPMSNLVGWHYMRHHHAGLALAWVLALSTLALAWGARPALRPWRWLALAIPLGLATQLPDWADRYRQAAQILDRRNGAAARWLAEERRPETLLLNDAGLLALGHDGPMVDMVGLGSNGLARAFRHGPGALAEALARRPRLPSLAAVHPDLFRVPGLLGPPLLPPAPSGGLILAELTAEPLRHTVRDGSLDFAYLPDESGVRWTVPPHPNQASYALLLSGTHDRPELQGCRPLFDEVRIRLPPGDSLTLRVASLTDGASLELEGVRDPVSVPADRRWHEIELAPGSEPGRLRLRRAGPGVACLESVGAAGSGIMDPLPAAGDAPRHPN